MLQTLDDEVGTQRWQDSEELLATIAETLHALYRLTYSVHTGKTAPVKQLEWPRPKRERVETPPSGPDGLRASRQDIRRALLGGGKPHGIQGR